MSNAFSNNGIHTNGHVKPHVWTDKEDNSLKHLTVDCDDHCVNLYDLTAENIEDLVYALQHPD
jgi:hypothetical protein